MIRDGRFWVWLAAGALGLALVAAVGIASYRAIDEELTRLALSRRSAVAYLAATTLAEKLGRLRDLGTALATRVRFRELVAAGRWDEAVRILSAVPHDFPFVDRIELVDRAGVVRAGVPPSVERGASLAHLDWYRGVSAEWRPYVSEAYRRGGREPVNVFAVAAPITGPRGEVAGILVIELRLERFFDWVERIDSPQGETIFVVDRAGRLVFHPARPDSDALADFRQAPGVERALAGRAGVELAYSTLDGEEVVAAYVPVGDGWAVVAQQPARFAFEQKNLLLTLLRTAYLLAAVLCAAAAVLAARIVGERRRAGEERRIKAELEERVVERTAQLEAANRDLESFSYSIAHDLRAPLRAIDGFSRILLDEHAAQLSDEGRRQLGIVRANVQQMARLIDDLLSFSRLARQTASRQSVDMQALVAACFEELAHERKERDLTVTVETLPPADGDPAMLKQVWLNLISNAIKYTRRKAGAEVHAGFQGAAGAAGAAAGAGAGAYYVRDNGVGFDMAYADKLFGVFQRLHRAEEYEGTGVGLAIAAHIVQHHGGRIWAHAAPGKGATFYFTLEAGHD